MKMKKWIRGLLSLALCASVVNAFGGSTVTVHAEDDDSDGIVANKTATVDENDGSYNINLEAYVKGEVVTVTKNVDVVLIVDVSNSMAWRAGSDSGDGLNYNQTKLYSAMQAAKTLSNIILKDEDGAATGNSLSFVTFAGYDDRNHRPNSNTYFDSVQTVFYNYTDATEANNKFDDVYFIQRGSNYYLTFDGNQNIQNNAHNNMGGTNYDYAFWQAEDVVDDVQAAYSSQYAADERETFVIFMTDGAPSLYNDSAASGGGDNRNTIPGTQNTYNDFPHTGGASADNWYSYISTTINGYAEDVYDKVEGNLYAIGFDLEHGGFSGWTFTGNNDLPRFLENMMYSDNTSGTAGGERKIPVETATTAEELKEIFESLAEEIGSAAIDLNEEAVLKDIVAKSFTLPEGADASNIIVNVVKWDQTNQKWSDTPITAADWKTQTGEDIQVTVNGDTVDVTGFDYSKHFLVDTEEAGKNADAAKIVVTFKIYARPDSITGSSVVTNGAESGIYDADGNAVTTFDIPNVKYENETYIIDYAKETTLKYDSILQKVTRIDDPSDEILKGLKVEPDDSQEGVPFDYEKTYETDYAYVTYENVYDGTETELFKITYTPKTMNWDGYDNLFVMGKPNNADASIEGGNVWGMMTVLPANNVYYEDTFVTKDVDGEETGYIGITYTGSWTQEGTSGEAEENANGDVMGWEESLADDTQFSDGSAHIATIDDKTKSATASFSFTGTGVDIYSRTNLTTGTIIVRLTGASAEGTSVAKNVILSNKANSGDYYQIPTCTFDNLDYGTYNVKITVTSAAAAQGRTNYYLDGIRVYNPIQPKESEELVKEAYEDELGAVFTEVKDLLKAGQLAFIDEDSAENESEMDYSTTEFDPEHEVYVSSGNSVVIAVEDTSKNYYMGIKAPAGETTIEITDGSNRAEKTISHSTDLYYKVTPNSDGEIVIENTGSNLLSLTKIRTTNPGNTGADPAEAKFSVVSPERALSAVASFRAANLTEEETEILTPEEAEFVEPTEPEEVIEEVVEEVPEEPEVEIVELAEEDITIETPVPEEAPKPVTNSNSSLLKRFVQSLFSAVLRLFR